MSPARGSSRTEKAHGAVPQPMTRTGSRKRAPYVRKRAPYIRKRALCICKRAPYVRKRAMYVRKKAPYIRKRALCICKRDPCVRNRAPDIHQRTLYIRKRALYILYIRKRARISAKEPYASAKEPCSFVHMCVMRSSWLTQLQPCVCTCSEI